MPKVKLASGKVKHFPYTKAGVKAAKAEANESGGKYTIMNRKKSINTYGLRNLKKG